MLNNWQRLERVVKWAGLSVNSFALSIGLHRSENLYQIKRGNHGISRELAGMISSKYPQISKAWLLTGEGDMFTREALQRISIPFYDADVEKFILQRRKPAPRGYISVPTVDDAEFAGMYFGRAMGDAVPPGSVVMLKKVSPDNLVPGGDYLVVGDNAAMLRRVRRNVDSGKLRLMPIDEVNFDEVRLDEEQVRELYLVRAVVIHKTL